MNMLDNSVEPGPITVFGSGETATEAQRVHDRLMRRMTGPIRAVVLETPAGFEPNSGAVAGRLADFIRDHLPNYRPSVEVVPARRRGSPYSPDDPEIARPVFAANYILAGPGSPTYAVRQLTDSLVWQATLARHRLGSTLVFASAMSVAIGHQALPVYEIYKAGEDLHWKPGLDLLGAYGLRLALVPHWNNTEGGSSLDTSRCFMGAERFGRLCAMLEADTTIVGIDEHTALTIDLTGGKCEVFGAGGVTVVRSGLTSSFQAGESFDLGMLGAVRLPEPGAGLPDDVWRRASETEAESEPAPSAPPAEVTSLVAQRTDARARRDWSTADAIRGQIAALGWLVVDTPAGPEVQPAPVPEKGL
jgi:hypothetical protein